jgi:hypothetical protein
VSLERPVYEAVTSAERHLITAAHDKAGRDTPVERRDPDFRFVILAARRERDLRFVARHTVVEDRKVGEQPIGLARGEVQNSELDGRRGARASQEVVQPRCVASP